MEAKLEVLICTLGQEGLSRLSHLPVVEGIGYLISVQGACDFIPAHLQRSDIRLLLAPGRGISKNRNFAFENTRAPYALIADDDLRFIPQGLLRIVKAFDENPGMSIAAFRCIRKDETVFPKHEHNLFAPVKNYNPISVEIAVRMADIKRVNLRFCESMGIGASFLQAAEENVFLLAAKRHGLQGRFFPVDICAHPHPSTAEKLPLPAGVLRAEGAYIILRWSRFPLPRLLLKSVRCGGNAFRNGFYILQGALYALGHKKALMP